MNIVSITRARNNLSNNFKSLFFLIYYNIVITHHYLLQIGTQFLEGADCGNMKFLLVAFIMAVVIAETPFGVGAFISNGQGMKNNLKISRYSSFAVQNNDNDSVNDDNLSKLIVI